MTARPPAVLRGRLPYLWLSLLCALLYLPGIASLPPFDRDEARYVQATRQMLETADFVSIRFQAEARNKKPVGIHWLQAASVGLLSSPASTALWPYRLTAVLGAWLAVLLSYRFAREHLGRRRGLLAAALVAASLGLVVEAHQAKTDAVLLATVVLTQGALARAYLAWRRPGSRGPGWPSVVAFWVGLGAGFLLKGPVGPGITLLTALVLSLAGRSGRWLLALRPLPGSLMLLAIVLPWSVAVTLGPEGDFFYRAAREDLLPKLLGAQESHGAPPGYYALTSLLSFWPGSLLLLPALVVAWRERADPLVAFCLAWVLPAWTLLELVPTKLPHYVLPLFPALAVLIVRAVPQVRPRAAWTLGYLALWLLGALACAFALARLPLLLELALTASRAGLAVVLAAASAAGAYFVARGQVERGLWAGVLGALIFVPWLAAAYLPPLGPLWLSAEVARSAEALRRYPGETVAVAGYAEPSLVFLLGTPTRLTDVPGVVEHLRSGPSRLAVVSESRREDFETALADQAIEARRAASVRGFQYSKGRWTTLHVYLRTR